MIVLISHIQKWWCPFIYVLLSALITTNIAFDFALDLVIMSQHRGHVTKQLLQIVPNFIPLSNDKTRIAILFSDHKPYVGLNFTGDKNHYQQMVQKSVQHNDSKALDINETAALKIAREQLFVHGNARENSAKAILFVQHSRRINAQSDALEEVAALNSMNVSIYVVCFRTNRQEVRKPTNRQEVRKQTNKKIPYIKRKETIQKCGGVYMPAQCNFNLQNPSNETIPAFFRLLIENVELKVEDNNISTCGNGTGHLLLKGKYVATTKPEASSGILHYPVASFKKGIVVVMMLMITKPFLWY